MSRWLVLVLLAFGLQLLCAGETLAKDTSSEVSILQQTTGLTTQVDQETGFAAQVAAMSSSMNTIGVISGIAAAFTGVWFFWLSLKDLAKYLKRAPLFVYEIILYSASVGMIFGGTQIGGWMRSTVIITGCALLLASTIFTLLVRKLGDLYAKASFGLFVVWALLAIVDNNSGVGFLAVAALLSALGFSVLITPLCYYIGFRDEGAVGRTTTAAFLILLTFIGLRLLRSNIPQLIVFDFGAVFMGSFVGYLGLLILSSKWYTGRRYHYAIMQVITILAGIAAIFVGTFLRIEELQKIGGTFFVLYLLEKPFELAEKNFRTWMGILFLSSLVCFVLSMLYGIYENELNRFLFLPRVG